MDATQIETTIEHLDFEPDIPCGGKAMECGQPADFLTEHRCPECGYHHDGAQMYACRSCWANRSRRPARCSGCARIHPHGDAWRIVEVLR